MQTPKARLATAVALTLLVAAAGVSSARAEVKVRLGDLAQSINGIASGVLIEQGFDKKHGIDVDYSTFPTLDGLFTAIRGKELDVGFSGWTAIAQFRSKGFPVSTIFPVGRGVTLDVITLEDSPYASLADLKGKRVGSYAGAAGTGTVLFRVLATKYFGYDPAESGDMQYAGPGLMPTLVEQGEVEAALLFDPLAAKAVASPKFKSIANLADVYKEKVGEDFLWIGYASNDDFMKAHPDALKAFVKAWLDAVNYVKTHPEVFEAYGKKIGLDADGIALLRERVTADYVTTWDETYIKSLRHFAEMANEVMGGGYLDEIPDAAFSTEFVPQGYQPGK